MAHSRLVLKFFSFLIHFYEKLDLKLDDETLYFQYNGKHKENFVLQLSEYPRIIFLEIFFINDFFLKKILECILFYGSETKTTSEPLPILMKNIAKEFNARYESKSKKEESEGSDMEEDEEEYEGSEGSEGEGLGDLGASGNWEKEVLEQELSYKEHEVLTLELENHRKIFGEDSATTRPMPGLDVVDVELKLDVVNIIDETVCNAWGVDPYRPVIIK